MLMTATAHALVAGAIASKFTDPVTASALALTSHFIMDAVPHWDVGTNWRKRSKNATGLFAIIETVVGILVAYYFFGSRASFPLLSLAIFFSLLPDWLETPWYIFFAGQKKHEPSKNAGMWEKLTFRIYKTENAFHTKAQFPFGVITQIATVIFFLVLLK